MTSPSFEEFRRFARDYPVVPVHREVLADLATPVSVFRRLDPTQNAALLESVEGGETWGRFSIIGLDPGAVYTSRGGEAVIRDESGTRREVEAQPLDALDHLLDARRAPTIPNLPRSAGGAIGFASYDMVRRIERIPETSRDEIGVPDALFVLFETAILFDHSGHTALLVVHVRPGSDPKKAYEAANERLDALERFLGESAQGAPAPRRSDGGNGKVEFRSRMGKPAYLEGVRRAKEYIRAGDIVQVVLSHRLEADLDADPFDVYRALRVINPSPYMFFLRLDGWSIAGSSPEVLVRRERDVVQARPIAGTRARGSDELSDRFLEDELRANEKERAEHIMLVDLGRNDLGRICRYGTVETNELLVVERYSHVMHLVSNVRGILREGKTNSEILRACFPAGTVSGAPKIRAMEIIEELEPLRRGLYAGAVGYMDYHGNMDTAIAIRTILFHQGKAYLGVGAGIVADSDPEAEWEETLRKGSALVRACEVAGRGLTGVRASMQGIPDLAGENPGGGR
jgi:anthranilate synthase component 1